MKTVGITDKYLIKSRKQRIYIRALKGTVMKKSKFTRTAALLLAVLMLLPIFSACGNKEKVVLEYKGYEITEGMYSYWMKNWKDYYLEHYSDVKDTPEYWNSMNESGVTNGEYLSTQIKTRIDFYLIGMVLFDELGLKLSDETKKSINDDINAQIGHYGSRSEYVKVLKSEYGMTISEIKKVFTAEEEYLAVYEYLYDEIKGKETASEAELDEYYNTYYARVKYVMFLKNIKYVYNDDGTRKTDSNGMYLTAELTEDEKAEVTEKADSVYKEALEGANMNDLMVKYMEEFGFSLSSTPNGFYISADDYTSHSSTVTVAALEMKENEVKLCENDDCYFIIKKFDLPEKGYASTTDSKQFEKFVYYVNSQKFAVKFSELAKNIEYNKEIIDKYVFEEL